jgi:hypothetical protein
MLSLEAAERILAAQESAEDRDLPPEDISDDGLAQILHRLRGHRPTRAEIDALRAATRRERGRRRARRNAGARAELRAEAAAEERRRRTRPQRQAVESPDALVRELLESVEGQIAIQAAWLLCVQLARAVVVGAAQAERGLPGGARPRDLAALTLDYCRAKLGHLSPEAMAGALADARWYLPRPILAWVNAAHVPQVAELAEELATIRERSTAPPLRRRLRALIRGGAACQNEWPELARAEAGPPRGLLPLPPPDEGEEPAPGAAAGAAPAPGLGR